MKVVVSKNDLVRALQVTNNTVSSGAIDLSTHFVFRLTESKQLEILSYGGRLFSSAICKGTSITESENTSFTIEAKRLNLWLSAVGDSALTLTFDGVATKATSPMGSQTFRSLDPSSFPYWDEIIGEAKETATLSASALKASLAHLKKFISSDDTKRPSFCVAEAREGVMMACSVGIFSAVKMADLSEDSTMRINGKNVNSIVSYLNLFDDNEITVLEHPNFVLYKGFDGSMLGESRDTHKFPKLSLNFDEKNTCSWLVGLDDLKNALVFLKAGAPHEDHIVKFQYKDEDNISVGMAVAGPSGGDTFVDLKTITQQNEEELGEFKVNYKHLEMILSTLKDDRINFGLLKNKKGGMIRVLTEKDNSKFLSILTWLK